MMIRKLIFKVSGKEDKDKNIPTTLLIQEAYKYFLSRIRGATRFLFFSKGAKIFIGRKSKVIGKKYCSFKGRVVIGENCHIQAYSSEGITIGNHSKIGDNSVIRCSNVEHLGKGLKIGNYTSFDADCFFGAAGFIEIGDNVIAGRNIKFHAENHLYTDANKLIREQGVTSAGIIVGNNCWIGSNVIFTDGASIGDGCVVAAGAVVTKAFPNDVVIGGVPARIIKQRVFTCEI